MEENEQTKPVEVECVVECVTEIPVRVVRVQGHAVLVEFRRDGRLERRVMPAGAIVDGACTAAALSEGVAYGIPWAELVALSGTAELLEENLHIAGIWTPEDLAAPGGAQTAYGALQKTYGVDLSQLVLAASRFKQSNRKF
jgi:class 3 adenylate cyclase